MIIYAVNIHSGGGKILLDEVLLNSPLGPITVAFIDQRYKPPKNAKEKIEYIKIKPKLLARWKAEIQLKRIASLTPHKTVLCFGNLPTAFKLKNKTILYIQNAFTLPKIAIPFDNLKSYLRNYYDKLWLRFFVKNIDEIYVQTKWMKEHLDKNTQIHKQVTLKPFLPSLPTFKNRTQKYDFISITGVQKHKHLRELLEGIAFSKSKDAKFLIACETSSKEIDILVQKLQKDGFKVQMNVNFSRDELLEALASSRALIITSEIESFCLPLHESLNYNLDIISGSYPFILEYTTPTQEINPKSPETIGRAISKYLNLN